MTETYLNLEWPSTCAESELDWKLSWDADDVGSIFRSERERFGVNSETPDEVLVPIRNPYADT